jgi:hypothetical protein
MTAEGTVGAPTCFLSETVFGTIFAADDSLILG